MEILVAKTAGFCFGVKRAINMAYSSASPVQGGEAGEDPSKKIYTLGPLIHNPQVVKDLEKAGVFVVNCLADVDEGPLIVRSHGITSSEMEEAGKKGLAIIDATCPFVKKAQEHVRFLSKEGYYVVIVGEESHPEVKGLLSYAGKDVMVVNCLEGIKKAPKKRKIGVVAQTTQSLNNFQSVVSFFIGRAGEIRVFNTICNATSVRQNEAKEIAREVDCMIVVGGYNSGNTNRLADICREILENTHHIEVADEVKPEWIEGAGKVGISGGASTPPWIIDAVNERIKELSERYNPLETDNTGLDGEMLVSSK